MNTTLLRLARRNADGIRYWSIPGAPNEAALIPGKLSMWGVPAFRWPELVTKGDETYWQVRSVRLDWHRSVAKKHIREILRNIQ